MATTLYMSPISMIVQYLTNIGILAQGGQIFTYVGGTPNTPATTYTDSTGLVQNPNPMALPASARPASASGAPVAFWTLPGVSLHLVVNDVNGTQLVNIDNIPSINDLTSVNNSLAALLASPASSNVSGTGPVAGADLVANAVKSYDVFADVRTANVPNLAAGQTLNIEMQGGNAVNDGLGGTFLWSVTSAAADDGRNVLKPNGAAGTGRYLRVAAIGVAQYAIKTADQSVTTSTVLVNDTQLTLPLVAGATYEVKLRLQMLGIGGTGQGWKVNLAYSGTVANGGAGSGVVTGNSIAVVQAAQVGTGFSNAALSSTVDDAVNINFTMTTGASGAITVQFAQASSSANATVMKTGSVLVATRVA